MFFNERIVVKILHYQNPFINFKSKNIKIQWIGYFFYSYYSITDILWSHENGKAHFVIHI